MRGESGRGPGMSNSTSIERPEGLAAMIRSAMDRIVGRGGVSARGADQRNALLAFGVRVTSAGILFASQVALARWMGAAEYGIYIYAWTWVLLLGGIATLGVNVAAIRFVSEYKATGAFDALRGFLLGGRLLVLGVSTAVAVVTAWGIWSLAARSPSGGGTALLIVLLALPAFTLTDVQDGVGRGSGRMLGALFPPYIVRPSLILCAIGIAHFNGLDLNAAGAAIAAVAATWCAWLVQTVIVERGLRRWVPSGPRVYRFRVWFKTSLPLMLIGACDLALQNTDVIVISNLLSPVEAAIYFAAAKTMGLIVFVHYAVGSAMANRFSAHTARGDAEAMKASARDAVRWTFWPSLALGLVMLAAGRPLLSLFGPQFVQGYPVMCILVVAFLVRAAIGPVDLLLNMSGGQAECARTLIIAAALNVALSVALVPLMGIIGAAVALALALATGAFLNYRAACRRLGFDIGIWAAWRAV